MRNPLLTTMLTIAVAGALAPTAAAGPTARDYKLWIKGEQRTEWSYEGRSPGDCGAREHGSGTQDFTFRSAPVKVNAGAVGRRWTLTAPLKLEATGSRTGEHHVLHSECDSGTDFHAPSTDCGQRSWTIDAFVSFNLQRPYEQVTVQSAAGRAPSGSLFLECPWFEGPSDQTYRDQTSRGGTQPSNDLMAGLRFSGQDLRSKTVRRGRSFDVSRRLTKTYVSKDSFGALNGRTVLRWTLYFKRAR